MSIQPAPDWSALHAQGWNTFALPPGAKSPDTPWKRWQTERSTPEDHRRWQASGMNAALVTGALSQFVALDCDSPEAVAEAERLGVGDAPRVDTARGAHFYFRHPGGKVGNKVGLRPGMDLRADGGFVVAPGSIHPSGVLYRWHRPPAGNLPPLPDWVTAAPERPAPAPSSPPGATASTRYGEAALQGEVEKMRTAPAGTRNAQLNRSAFALAQLAIAGDIDASEGKARLSYAAHEAGLDTGEIETTLASGWQAGREQPRIAKSAPPVTAPHPVRLDLAALPLNPPPVPFVVPGWLPAGVVTLFAAHGGSGKSYIALWIALCLAIGRHPFEQGCTLPRQRVLLYSAEDGLVVLQWRIRQYVNLLGVDPAGLDDWLTVLDATGSENALFRAGGGGGGTTQHYDWLTGAVARADADVLIFDNASDALDANENDRASVRQFMSALRSVAPTILLLAHVDAASSMASGRDALKGYSGSTAWHNSARSRWFLTKDADGTLSLTQPKVNYGRAGSQVLWAWDDEHGVFIVTGSFAQAPSGEAYRPQLLALLAKALDEGQTVSPHPNANNNAAKAIMTKTGFPARLGRGELRKEIEAWHRLGLVQRESVRTDSRKTVDRLVLTKAGRAMAAGEAAAETGNAAWSEDEF